MAAMVPSAVVCSRERSTTRQPASAATSVIPPPMMPDPITPTLLTAMGRCYRGARKASKKRRARRGSRRVRAGERECVIEILQEVLGGLETDRQPDERGIDFELGAGDRGVGHLRRVLDQRLDRPEGFGQREQTGAAGDVESRRLASPGA